MKIIFKNLKKGKIKIKTEGLNDLWYLNRILEPNDLIKGKAERKINLSKSDQKARIKKVYVNLVIALEKIEFDKYSNVLRLLGKIKQGPEDLPKDAYQTINVELNSIITITKDKWLPFQLKILNESLIQESDVLAVILDREEAIFALITTQGFKVLSEIKGNVEKKDFKITTKGKFYSEVISNLMEYENRYQPKTIILASPAFWKEDLKKEIKDNKLNKKIILATCNHVGVQGLSEILKRKELTTALSKVRTAREEVIIDKLMKEIKNGNKAAYGFQEVKEKAEVGAVEILLITDSLLQEFRQSQKYEELEKIMKNIELNKAKIEIINSENSAGKQLNGLGGIGAILRY